MKHVFIRLFAVIAILLSCFATGFSFAYIAGEFETIDDFFNGNTNPFQSAKFLNSVAITTETEFDPNAFNPFWEAWDLIHNYYVTQPVDDYELMEGAIRGMLEVLGDRHTRYSSANEYQQESSSIAGEYEGIGAWVNTDGDYVEITSPMVGSPAEEAGLKPRDRIIAIDGIDMSDTPANKALQKILGPANTTVVLTVQRENETAFDVSIVRRKIVTPMVSWEVRPDGIAYIQLTQFGDTAASDLRKALDEILPQKPVGMVLDLRNNGGGYVHSVVQIASEFLPKNQLIFLEKSGDGEVKEYRTSSGGRALNIPLTILGNGGSASASEILIGTLRSHNRAILIGEQTFGKGSIQVQPILSNGGAVSVTIAHWYTPDDEIIHGAGISPDIAIEVTEEDIEKEFDAQLERAVQFLLNGEQLPERMLETTEISAPEATTSEPQRKK